MKLLFVVDGLFIGLTRLLFLEEIGFSMKTRPKFWDKSSIM